MTVLKADQQAAERLLKAAVRRAVEMLREPGRLSVTEQQCTYGAGGRFATNANTTQLNYSWVKPDRTAIAAMLTAAGESAALLLDERPAKKAAARKGAS